jgi:hypothetical protein
MTDDEFDALPHRQTIEKLSEWRVAAPVGAFCCAWTERIHATHHAEERSLVMRMAASWRDSGLVNTFWKRAADTSHLLVQKRIDTPDSIDIGQIEPR